MISVEWLKGIVLCTMLVGTFAFSMIPLVFVSLARRNLDTTKRGRLMRGVSFLSCFAGGVFMATCILDLFPDVRDKLSQVFDSMNWFSSFPVAEFVMSFGFFLVLIIEQITCAFKEVGMLENGTKDRTHSRRSLLRGSSDASLNLFITEDPDNYQNIDPFTTESISTDDTEQASALAGKLPNVEIIPPTPPADAASPLLPAKSQHKSVKPSIVGISDQPKGRSSRSLLYGSVQHEEERSIEQNQGHHHHHHYRSDDTLDQTHSFSRSMILVLALTIHSTFEGLAVGLQDTVEKVLDIFTVLILHKCILAFSLGLELIQSDLSFRGMFFSNLLFSVMSPLGIGIGMGLSDFESGNNTALAAGILQGIACGTFLYVTFFEILPHEMNASQDRLLKLLCLISGFAAVCGMLMLHGDVIRPSCYRGAEPV